MFTVKPFSQQDPQWKNQPLGFNPQTTIGKMGCLLTDLAMVAAGFGFNETPATLNQKMVALGVNVGFIGELIVPAAIPRVLPGMVFRDFLRCPDTPAPMERIDAALAAGWPVIVELDYDPKPDLQNHWVVLYDKQGGDYLLQDPWPFPPGTDPVFLSRSRFAFAGTAEKIITAVVWMEGPRALVNKPVGAVTVYATVVGLALRTQSVIDPANLIKRVGLLDELYSLEPVDDTLFKVGVANHWLHVQDTEGVKGYAAAWYLNTRREVPGEPPAAPPITPEAPLSVFASVDQLALRSQPVVSAETLLKRLPVGCELTTLEPPADVVRKVGKLDLWLKVKDQEGDEGYVAAWYTTSIPTVGLGPIAVTPPEPAPPEEEPPKDFHVVTTVPALGLRAQPQILPETLIKRVPFLTKLLVLETEEEARRKIGSNGQWLKVRDPDQDEGFIAAWFVKPEE
jgi:hypothetical protein